ncbi:sodium:proton antiporter [Roseateles violae]|uniref:Sodium:proton antiporter n=1 Tax=Roseateles violae TaxID=3058042 RepID=A0ABT8DZ26_9BURK|nr:sodium:proton antiporter [Pelomonas sp. PFR6]MDN3922813.1 sodium:proton antiporter [Pelomonas sp. PFR6]
MALDGSQFGALWALPFGGLLLSIAVLPLAAPRLWHAHFGKIAAAWSLVFLLPFARGQGLEATAELLVHTLLADYLPFIILLTALFTAAGGIYLRGNLHGSAGLNTGLMAIGALLASLMGTTGAAMLLVRPLLRTNDNRRRNAHVMIFFIFIVGNAGGALTPLGDPPLFLGFLKGVDFLWPLRHLWPQALFLNLALLAIFYAIDSFHFRREGPPLQDPTPDTGRLGIEGGINFLPLLAIAGLVLMSGSWKPGIAIELLHNRFELQALLRDALLLAVIAWSLAITPRGVREKNQFSWAPMAEVAKLFAGIFLTMAPVLAALQAGEAGAFAAVVHAVADAEGRPLPQAYFWASGLLSGFLDNAPTYLVFFNLAGGDPQQLMGTQALVLAAISAGSVFMGALSYIGNAPNFMVKAVAEQRGVRMPGFFGYMGWSCALLLPLCALMGWIWFR